MKVLTKREKMLLYILAYILIIIVGGFMICLPVIEKHSELNDQFESMETQLSTIEASVVEYKDLDKKIEAANDEYNKQLENFYTAASTNTEDIDQIITKMAIDHGLKPTSLQINEVVTEEIVSFEDFMKQMKKADDTKDTASEEIESKKVKVYNASLNVSGTIANLQKLVDDANTNKTLKVTGVTYTTSTGSKTMTVVFKVYMI